ncbi:MAG: PGPGW domain-containing protein [Actinobacteria bacterium]|nr:PGPGW domain-containing protein [Actinomycetota bacterium]
MQSFRAVVRFIGRNARRMAITIVGFAVILAGAVLSLPGIPGPGIAIMFGGLAILATEYAWARRTLDRAKDRARRVAGRFRRRPRPPGEPVRDVPHTPPGPEAEHPSA